MRPLTSRQEEVLQAIAQFWKMGRPPTTGELLEALHLESAKALVSNLRPLQQRGLITVKGGTRGRQNLIEMTAVGRAQAGFGIPVLGDIPAGPLAEAIQSAEWLDGIGSLLYLRANDFLLRVKGDSMKDAGILEDDYVQLRPDIAPTNGEIVAAQICDEGAGRVEATLKYLDFTTGAPTVQLRPANADYPTREYPADCVKVAGVYRGLIRIL